MTSILFTYYLKYPSNIGAMTNIISNIITNREDEDESNQREDHLSNIQHLPSSMLGVISNWLPLNSYNQFARCSRTIYTAINAPITLSRFTNNAIYHCPMNQLSKFQYIESLEMNYKSTNDTIPILETINTSNIKQLWLYDFYEYEHEDILNFIDSEQLELLYLEGTDRNKINNVIDIYLQTATIHNYGNLEFVKKLAVEYQNDAQKDMILPLIERTTTLAELHLFDSRDDVMNDHGFEDINTFKFVGYRLRFDELKTLLLYDVFNEELEHLVSMATNVERLILYLDESRCNLATSNLSILLSNKINISSLYIVGGNEQIQVFIKQLTENFTKKYNLVSLCSSDIDIDPQQYTNTLISIKGLLKWHWRRKDFSLYLSLDGEHYSNEPLLENLNIIYNIYENKKKTLIMRYLNTSFNTDDCPLVPFKEYSMETLRYYHHNGGEVIKYDDLQKFLITDSTYNCFLCDVPIGAKHIGVKFISYLTT